VGLVKNVINLVNFLFSELYRKNSLIDSPYRSTIESIITLQLRIECSRRDQVSSSFNMVSAIGGGGAISGGGVVGGGGAIGGGGLVKPNKPNKKKIEICHQSWSTIKISEDAWPAYLLHGDLMGSCENALCKFMRNFSTLLLTRTIGLENTATLKTTQAIQVDAIIMPTVEKACTP